MSIVKKLILSLFIFTIIDSTVHTMKIEEKKQFPFSYWPASKIKDFVITEIEKNKTEEMSFNQETFINLAYALELMNQKEHGLARELLKIISSKQNKQIEELLLTESYKNKLSSFINFCEETKKHDSLNIFEIIVNAVKKMDVLPLHYIHPYRAISYNSYYTDKEEEFSLTNEEKWKQKQINVSRTLALLKPKKVLDIGANMGWFSQLATKHGAHVISTDIYPYSVNYLYETAKEKNLPITPLEVSFEELETNKISLFESDMVLFLAIVHHLVFIRGIKLNSIFELLSKVTKKTLIFEFVDIKDENIQRAPNDPSRWNSKKTHEIILETLNGYASKEYNLENCISIANKYFSRVEIFESHPSTRTILVLTK